MGIFSSRQDILARTYTFVKAKITNSRNNSLPLPLTFGFKSGIIYGNGELSERFKEPVLKTGDGATHREFESHTLRQKHASACFYYFRDVACHFFRYML